ncbi:beta-microseminoprotein-like [Leptodactylus fuscus]|uniref:beta-microseminoprotein-like n=1 Tax=Leptodactylus fuscus TaxID=238119 RepID=UPI003F4F0049
MKFLLIVLLSVGIFVNLCNAACFNTAPKPRKGRNPGGCRHEGETHDYGSSWRTKNCMDCSCSDDGSIRCCDIGGTPVGYNKEKCTDIFDKEACVHHVVRNDDPCKECEHAMVG